MTSSTQLSKANPATPPAPAPAPAPAASAMSKPIAAKPATTAPPAPQAPPRKVGVPSMGHSKATQTIATKLEKQKSNSETASYGIFGTLTLKESAQYLGVQLGYAFTLTIALLIGIEWLMPGSVLPFINIISLLPASFIIVVLLIAFKTRTTGSLNTINILIGIIITIALLASLLTSMPISGLRTLLLAGAFIIVIGVWAYSMYTEH